MTPGPVTRALIMLLALTANIANAAHHADRCPNQQAAQAAVVAVMTELYSAARVDDLNRLRELVAPDFYAFDGGKQFVGASLFDYIRDLHSSGLQTEWHVGPADVHVHCAAAWITYINAGAIGAAGAMKPVSWLESAILEYRQGRWRLRFLHSTRAADTS